MTEPSRSSPEPDRTQMESGHLDPTLVRPDGNLVLPLNRSERELNFGPPEQDGDLGKLGRYRVLKKLGAGGMGAVYLGSDTVLARRVALKVMLPQYAADPESRARFLREASAAATVKSDHVVTIHDIGEERGVPFIAMEYLLGYPLDQFLRVQGNPSLAHVLRIGREAALGLAAAHKLGLVHRDVKPGNIWLEAPKGRVKLLDFGLARTSDDDTHLTTSGFVVGTPAFMSPEQARNLKLDARSDLFSLGVMLYRIATGKMPFTGATTMAVLTSLAVDTPPPARQVKPTIPEALEAIIAKLLAKNPAERFQTAKEVVDAILDAERQKQTSGQVTVELVPMAIAAQTEAVPVGHDAPGSSPWVVSATPELEPEPIRKKVERRKTARKKAAQKSSNLAITLACASVFIACVALATVLLWPKKKPAAVQNDDPGTKGPLAPTGGKQPPPKSTDATTDHKGAEYVFSVGGTVRINGDTRDLTAADLPKEPFTLTSVNLAHLPAVTDANLANLKDCKNITGVLLHMTAVTDAGLANFRGCPLTILNLDATRVTDTGLVNFRGCKSIKVLHLHATGVTDAGLANFNGATGLRQLRLSETKVTDAALANFADSKEVTELILYRTVIGDAGLAHLKDNKNLSILDLGDTQGSDTGMANFKDCKNLTLLSLPPKVTNAGIAHFRDCPHLIHLRLSRTGATDEALAHFKECKNLQILQLDEIPITDAGLAQMKACENLTTLEVRGTKVTAQGLLEFSKSAQRCRIVWDGGVIEPNPDRRAAEYALAVGGMVSVLADGKEREVKVATDLPKEVFALTTLNLSRKTGVTDAGLAAVAGCKNLKFLYLNESVVTDEGLKHFAGCTTLIRIAIYSTKVTGAGLAHFKDCKNLVHLGIDDTQVKDEDLMLFKDCAKLTFLAVSRTGITDAGLMPFKDRNLVYLDVHDTLVTDVALDLFKGRKSLTKLFVQKTKVTPAKVAEFSTSAPQCWIQWNGGIIEPTKK